MGKSSRPTAHQLFEAERVLRVCAVNYSTWLTATNRTNAIVDDARKELRHAAVQYARLVTEIEAP